MSDQFCSATCAQVRTHRLPVWLERLLGWRTVASSRRVCLDGGRVWSQAAQGRQILHCREGHVWVTQSGDNRDYILRGGEKVELAAGAKVVVSALEGEATFSFEFPI